VGGGVVTTEQQVIAWLVEAGFRLHMAAQALTDDRALEDLEEAVDRIESAARRLEATRV
jgi:hypothetical protein